MDKRKKEKLLNSFIKKEKYEKIYRGITPKHPLKDDLYVSGLDILYCFNGKIWEKIC